MNRRDTITEMLMSRNSIAGLQENTIRKLMSDLSNRMESQGLRVLFQLPREQLLDSMVGMHERGLKRIKVLCVLLPTIHLYTFNPILNLRLKFQPQRIP